jgi:hypothetical protein
MPRYEIETKFEIGQEVYMRTDNDGITCIVTGLEVRKTGVRYIVAVQGEEIPFYDFELLTEPRVNGVKYN